MRIATLPGVFHPHSDSWLLAEELRSQILPPGARALDLCTGSGVLAISAAQRRCDVTAVDRSRRAVWTTRINARLNGVRIEVRHGDLFGPVGDRRFDLIVSNPPYVPAQDEALPDRGPQRAWDAGLDGRVVLDRICDEAPAHLRPGGIVLLTHSSVCDEQRTVDALRAAGLEAEVVRRMRGPLGPLLVQRAPLLEQRGLLAPGRREEDIVIVRAQAAQRTARRPAAALLGPGGPANPGARTDVSGVEA
jgi:release factor glutamine methyltransferase